MNNTVNNEKDRSKLILCYTNIFFLGLSFLYSILLIYAHIFPRDQVVKNNLFPLFFGILIPVLFLISYKLNLKGFLKESKTLSMSIILIINFYTGIKWGFDLPSILISYIFCIVVLSLISKTKEVIIYLSIIISSIFIGNYTHNNLTNKLTWYDSGLYTNDIIEFSIMFIFIAFILIKFNKEQNKILTRTIRTENILRKERDDLENTVREKTEEIKQIQMEELSKIYHLIEFSKLSSGLYHDLMTPVQTMNIYIEKLTNDNLIHDSKFSKIIFNMKNTHEKLISMIQNIKKQIDFKVKDEKINLVSEINELINLVKNNYFKNDVTINYEPLEKIHILDTKRSVLNHILLNLVSNSYEACIQDKDINNKNEYFIKIISGKNKNKNKNYISVIDNGIGIKNENISKIFNDFYSSKNKNNCGIGLSSSKYFLEKYLNGKILIESEYSIGTTMTILF